MTLIDALKTDFLDLRKQRNPLASVLSVILGDIQLLEAKGKEVSDGDAVIMVKKLIKSNCETADAIGKTDPSDPRIDVLLHENRHLSQYLPETLSPDSIRNELTKAGLLDKLALLSNDGQKIGMAMKHLKGAKLSVEVDDVKQAIGI